MTKISVIVPAYNEEKTIIQLLERVAEQKIDGVELEVVVIDDGSKDGTVALLEARPELYAQLVKQPKNGGKGAAVKVGLAAASGEFILFQDADLEYDPAEYDRLFRPVLELEADIVMGSRFAAPAVTRVSYFWNKVGNRLITLIFNILNNTTFTDVYSCYLLYRKILVDPTHLRTLGWEQHAEILSLAVRGAKAIYEVPISYHGRTKDEGKKIRAHHIFAVVWTMFARRLSGGV
jgi:glycosyltransferase involved in cell wall biosynthesis